MANDPTRSPSGDAGTGMAYVGYCGSCGAMVAAIADEPDRKRDVAKFVADLVRDDCTIGRATDQQVRDGEWRCTTDCACRFCEKRRKKSQKGLAGSTAEREP